MCLEGYLGVRGECTTAKMYIDDLPGININNISDVIEGTIYRPSQLVDKIWGNTIDQVYNDWINHIKENYDYLGIISQTEYKTAGVYAFEGFEDETVKIEVLRNEHFSKFVTTNIYGFGIVSDRAANVDFVIKNEYNQIIETINKDLVEGYNDIEINVLSDSWLVTIEFSLSDFMIGRNASYIYNCNPCFYMGEGSCAFVRVNNSNIGFNLRTKCLADKCQIIDCFFENLKVPLLYKAGINYFLEVKMSGRVNAYTRNSDDKINEMLNTWIGGTDTVTGIKTPSAYWQSLKAAAESTISTLHNLKLPIFNYNSHQIINNLP